MEHLNYLSSDKKTQIHACAWYPQGEVKGVVQIVHGMAEYVQRYEKFAEFLVEHGYVVCGEDHIGHGQSVGEGGLGYFASGKGAHLVTADIRALHLKMKEKYPTVPYFMLGHSMGSFFARHYASEYGSELSGLVVMGSGVQPSIATGMGKFVCRLVALFKGWKHQSKLIDGIAFGSYNGKIKDAKTKFDWLSVNEENIQKYLDDDLSGNVFTCGGFYGLFEIIAKACKSKTYKNTPKNLPVYIVSGGDDPVGAYGKGVQTIYNKYQKAGVENLQMTIYRGARHEILNDICAEQVYDDLLTFFNELV